MKTAMLPPIKPNQDQTVFSCRGYFFIFLKSIFCASFFLTAYPIHKMVCLEVF